MSTRTVDQLLAELGNPDTGDVVTGETFPGRSATPATADALSRARSANRSFVAYSATNDIHVSESESDALRRAGALLLSHRRLCPAGHPVESAQGTSAQFEGALNRGENSFTCYHCEEGGKEYFESETTPPTE